MARGSPNISTKLTAADSSGRTGTHGILNGRGRSGRVRRSTITPNDTITNAISVPMLTSDPSVPIGVNPAASATTMPVTIVETCGV